MYRLPSLPLEPHMCVMGTLYFAGAVPVQVEEATWVLQGLTIYGFKRSIASLNGDEARALWAVCCLLPAESNDPRQGEDPLYCVHVLQ